MTDIFPENHPAAPYEGVHGGRTLDDPHTDRTVAAETVAAGLLDRIGGIIADLVAPEGGDR